MRFKYLKIFIFIIISGCVVGPDANTEATQSINYKTDFKTLSECAYLELRNDAGNAKSQCLPSDLKYNYFETQQTAIIECTPSTYAYNVQTGNLVLFRLEMTKTEVGTKVDYKGYPNIAGPDAWFKRPKKFVEVCDARNNQGLAVLDN